jgi:hypothetical protein
MRAPPKCRLKPRSHKIRRATKIVQSIRNLAFARGHVNLITLAWVCCSSGSATAEAPAQRINSNLSKSTLKRSEQKCSHLPHGTTDSVSLKKSASSRSA